MKGTARQPQPLHTHPHRKRSAQHHRCEGVSDGSPRGARRHGRLDAQHESAIRHRRRRTEPQRPESGSAEIRGTATPLPHITAKPQIGTGTESAPRQSTNTEPRLHVHPHMHKEVNMRTRTPTRQGPRSFADLDALGGESAPPSGAPRATLSRPCCATRSGCARRPRPRPGGHRWSPGTTGRPASPTGRAGPPC